MSLFTGEYECKLDAKGRLVLPARIKVRLPETAGNQVVLMRGMEPCIVLYSLVEYRKMCNNIASLNQFNEEYRRLQRNFFRRVSEIDIDNSGRVLIPKTMQSYAKMEKEVIVVGMGNRVEIWDPKLYEEFLIDDGNEFSQLAEKYLAD